MNKSWARGFEMNNDFIEKYSLEYLDFIRDKACCVSGQSVADPHHLHAAGSESIRKKPSAKHFTAVPLSRNMHTEVHQIGMHKFQEKHRIQLWQESHYLFISFLVLKGVLK